jgi:glycerate-2-kinase
LSHLERYDSYNLLRETENSIVITGSTGTNVGDVMLYLLPSSEKKENNFG